MRCILLATLISLGLAASIETAIAQPAPQSLAAKPAFALPPESITVIAVKPSDATIKSYVETRAVQTRVAGSIPRWITGVCPATVGLGDTYTKYISQRICEIAKAVGAPVNSNSSCRPNIQVLFTQNPQLLLDNVRKEKPRYLGYYNNESQADQLAKVTHPIQAWYTTTTIDMDGGQAVDDGACHSGGVELGDVAPSLSLSLPNGKSPDGPYRATPHPTPCAIAVHATGSRLNDGTGSGFFHVLIVAEPAKLLDYEVGPLADYITMLALSQPASLDSCQELPSISNLLVKGCTAAPAKITDGDLAYLQGLYSISSSGGVATQYNQLHYAMKKVLVTDKGGPGQ